MIIQSDSIGMNSARRYSSKQLSYSGLKVWDNNNRATATVGDSSLAEYVEDKSEKGLLETAKKVLGEEEKEKGIENIFEEIMAENYPNLKETISRYRKHRGPQIC